MLEKFDFSTLKKVGFYPKDMKFNDYEGQAKRVCDFFGIKSVYEYSEIGKGTRYHISEGNLKPPKEGEINEYKPFVRTIGGEGKNAKVIPITPTKPTTP